MAHFCTLQISVQMASLSPELTPLQNDTCFLGPRLPFPAPSSSIAFVTLQQTTNFAIYFIYCLLVSHLTHIHPHTKPCTLHMGRGSGLFSSHGIPSAKNRARPSRCPINVCWLSGQSGGADSQPTEGTTLCTEHHFIFSARIGAIIILLILFSKQHKHPAAPGMGQSAHLLPEHLLFPAFRKVSELQPRPSGLCSEQGCYKEHMLWAFQGRGAQ